MCRFMQCYIYVFFFIMWVCGVCVCASVCNMTLTFLMNMQVLLTESKNKASVDDGHIRNSKTIRLYLFVNVNAEHKKLQHITRAFV